MRWAVLFDGARLVSTADALTEHWSSSEAHDASTGRVPQFDSKGLNDCAVTGKQSLLKTQAFSADDANGTFRIREAFKMWSYP